MTMTDTIDRPASFVYDQALIWDNHAGFESRPDVDLSQLNHWRDSGASFVSVNVGYDVRPWNNTIHTLAHVRRWIMAQPNGYLLARNTADILQARSDGRLAIAFDIEGMEALDGNIDMIQLYYDLGVRQMLFAYNRNNSAGGGCHDEDTGLTPFGRSVVEEMNRVGMLVDCSHSAYRTTMDAMELSESPVTFSHSNPKALCDHPRNITDDQIRGCAATGGVIGINGIGKFLGDSIEPEHYVDHIAYTADLVGAQHVGVALDYSDGSDDLQDAITGQSHFWPPQWYEGKMEFMAPNRLIDAVDIMVRRNFSNEDITGILGGNFLALAQRVWL